MPTPPPPPAAPAGLAAVLREVLAKMQTVSGAEILSLYLFDAASRTFYAPFAVGIPEDNLLGSVSDMRDQLARYDADAAQGKAPDALEAKHYGPNVWLTVTRNTLYAPDAQNEIDSSFIRRLRIQSVVGLPLVAGDTLVGLLYLDFVAKAGSKKAVGQFDAKGLAALEQEASQAAVAIERAREAEERAAFVAAGRLAGLLGAPAAGSGADGAGLRRQLDGALAALLEATGFRAAAVYAANGRPGRLALAGAQGMPDAPAALDPPDAAPVAAALARSTNGAPDPRDPDLMVGFDRALTVAGASDELHPIAAAPLRRGDDAQGWLLLLSEDRLAALRRAPALGLLLQTAADLIAGALAGQRLIATLEETNRVLGALSRMSGALLQPGASRQQVLDAVVRHLTDPRVPEFAFQFATVFLLEDTSAEPFGGGTGSAPGSGLGVRMTAGAATATATEIDASPMPPAAGQTGAGAALGTGHRVPRWVQSPSRAVSPTDVLAYAARARQVTVVGAAPDGGDGGEEIVVGYPVDRLHRRAVPVVGSDGGGHGHVPAIVVTEDPAATGTAAAPTAGLVAAADPPATPFTLDGDIFAASGHDALIRVFVPFGLDAAAPATGVLEAGYHRDHRRYLDRTQIEALRACGAQVAVAVETARLYEDVKRHADQMEITTDVSKAIAASIDLDQTLRLVARNLVRLIDASLCQIALFEEDGTAWHGAAASDEEELWRRQRGERPEANFLFDVLDRRAPLVIEDAQHSDLVHPAYARLFGIRSLLALPLIADDKPIGAVVLGQRDRLRQFTAEEVGRTVGLAHHAAIALNNARLHAYAEEERHVQKDVVLVGYGEWARKAYAHLLTLKQFFNFKVHIVAPDRPGRREQLAAEVDKIQTHGDIFYWDHPDSPAREQLRRALESSCYVITYIATPAATHLPVLKEYYDQSNVVVIEKPLGAPPEEYRAFLDGVEGGVELVAADHYYFKLEVRLLQVLMSEERTLKAFIDGVEEIELELLEERPLTGAAADIGILADMLPHAFAIVSLFTPIDRIHLVDEAGALQLGRQEPLQGTKETYARLTATFPHQGRQVRLIITTGKGVENAKWIKLSGEKRLGSRRAFYKFDFGKGVATDGTQTNLRAAERPIREPGVPDNAHLTMLRHVIEKRHPAVGILAIREALRSNQRIQEIEAVAHDLLERGQWTSYRQGHRPAFPAAVPLAFPSSPSNEEPARQPAD